MSSSSEANQQNDQLDNLSEADLAQVGTLQRLACLFPLLNFVYHSLADPTQLVLISCPHLLLLRHQHTLFVCFIFAKNELIILQAFKEVQKYVKTYLREYGQSEISIYSATKSHLQTMENLMLDASRIVSCSIFYGSGSHSCIHYHRVYLQYR